MNSINIVDNQIEQFKANRYDNIENALMYIEKAIKICKENNLEDKLQECRYHYASAQFDKGNWKESLRINMDIKRIIEESGEKYVTKIQNFLTLGIYNFTTGNYEISLEYYLEALEEAERKNDLDNIAKLKTNISEIYRKLQDYKRAKEYLDEILIYEKNLSQQSLGVIYTNYAEILTEMKNFASGINFLNKSDEISKNINDNIGLAYNAMIKGRMYEDQGKYNVAEKYFLESLSIFSNAKDGIYIFEAYDDYIKLLIKKNELEKAENMIQEACKVLDGKDSLITELTLERHLASINYKKGKYKQAVDHFIAYDRIYDEYDINVLNMRLLAVKTKFDIVKSQREKKRIEKHNKELEEKHDVFEIATEIIKEITSTLELKEVVSKIQKQLKQAIPLDVFGLALYDKEKGEIIYEEYVEGDIGYGDVLKPIDINSKKNFTAYAVRNNEDIHLRTMKDKSKYVDELTIELFNRISETVIFKRLIFEDEILGVLTVQSYEKDIYDNRHIAIIDLITPYLAIAVNNSIKSNNLFKEIKEREKTEIKLKETNYILRNISNTDNLSGLYNRHYLNKLMDGIFYEKEFEGDIINLIMIDIDFFKEYNDNYGHVEGDKVIKQIGCKIKEICEEYKIDAFRYGGDEFLVTDYNLSIDDLENIGKRINTDIEKLKIKNSKSPISDYITVSVGITQVELEKSCNQNKLIKKVDNALYESKRVGRNRVIFI
ncbi:MAG: GGDEF domain-containing protein [Bacillota bacterium]|nr:GGDEF domain-containing protein [Bacillota bacterium]